MAANDLTISVAAGGANIDVHKLSRPGRDKVPVVGATQTLAAGSSNTVINVGPGETLIIERSDRKVDMLTGCGTDVEKQHVNR